MGVWDGDMGLNCYGLCPEGAEGGARGHLPHNHVGLSQNSLPQDNPHLKPCDPDPLDVQLDPLPRHQVDQLQHLAIPQGCHVNAVRTVVQFDRRGPEAHVLEVGHHWGTLQVNLSVCVGERGSGRVGN